MRLTEVFNVVPKYLEFAWVCAPNNTFQQIAANTITTLFMNTMLGDTVPGASITPGTFPAVNTQASTIITLPPGTYSYEAFVSFNIGNATSNATFGLYNRSNNTYVQRSNSNCGNISYGNSNSLKGQITLNQTTNFDLRLNNYYITYILSGNYTNVSTNSTPNADQRTTIKFWKLL
jgi:hypothetical protein